MSGDGAEYRVSTAVDDNLWIPERAETSRGFPILGRRAALSSSRTFAACDRAQGMVLVRPGGQCGGGWVSKCSNIYMVVCVPCGGEPDVRLQLLRRVVPSVAYLTEVSI